MTEPTTDVSQDGSSSNSLNFEQPLQPFQQTLMPFPTGYHPMHYPPNFQMPYTTPFVVPPSPEIQKKTKAIVKSTKKKGIKASAIRRKQLEKKVTNTP